MRKSKRKILSELEYLINVYEIQCADLKLRVERLGIVRLDIEIGLQETKQIQDLLVTSENLPSRDPQQRKISKEITQLEVQRDMFMEYNHENLLRDIRRLEEKCDQLEDKIYVLREARSRLKDIF
jgi:hypothetical protein